MEKGTVLKIIDKNKAIVNITEAGDCESCSARSGCNIFKKKDNTLLVKYSEKVEIGECVNIIVKPANRIFLSFLIFFLPLLFLFLSYYLGKIFFKNENFAVLSSFAGFILSFFLIIASIRINKNKEKMMPYITKSEKRE